MAGGFSRVPNAVLRDESLSPEAKLVYCVGMSFLNGQGAVIFPSYATLAKLTGFCRRTIIRAVKELEERRFWATEKRQKGGGWESSRYTYLDLPQRSMPSDCESPSL